MINIVEKRTKYLLVQWTKEEHFQILQYLQLLNINIWKCFPNINFLTYHNHTSFVLEKGQSTCWDIEYEQIIYDYNTLFYPGVCKSESNDKN